MSARTVEAKLLITGEDRASASIANVIKTFKQMEEVSKVSKPLQQVAKSLLEVERAEKAVNAAMSARGGLSTMQGDLQRANTALADTTRALDTARRAKAAFDGVKVVKGSEQAQQVQAATKAVREATSAYRAAEREVKKVSAAVSAQTQVVNQAERAVTTLGYDLGQLAAHQLKLQRETEQATAAMRQQVIVEGQAARAVAKHRAEEAEYQRHMRRHGAIGAAAAGAAGYVGVHSVTHGIGDAVKAGARYQHEVVALQNAGRTPAEMKEIEHASHETTKVVPTATFEENLKAINETTGAFGTLHHAIENLTFMQKSASVLHASAGDKIHEGAGELGNKLARFFEMRGTAGNTEVFQKEASEMIRAMVFTRGNFNPAEMLNFAQQAKASLPLYSERFMSKIAPSLVTEYGGDRAGTAANAFRNIIMGKANDKKQAEAWRDLGLLDEKQAIMKGGYAVSWKAGAIKNTNTALSDPLEWAEKTLIPALQKKGVNVDEKLELSKALGTLFRNSNSNLFAEALTQKLSRTRLHKDEDNINKSGTVDEVYKRNLAADPTQSLKAVTASLENLMTTASSPLMETAAGALKHVAEGINEIALAAKDHPNLAVAGGVGVAGAGLAGAGYLSYKLMTGFGLSTSAAALDHSAVMLDAAAVKLGAGGASGAAAGAAGAAAGAAGGAKKGFLGKFGSMLGKAAGAFGVYGLAEAAQENNVLPMPKAEDGLFKGTLRFLDPNLPGLYDRYFGDEAAKKAEEGGRKAGEKAGEGIKDGIQQKAPAVEQEGRTLYERLKELFAEGVKMPINFVPGEGAGGIGGGGAIQKASFDPGGGSASIGSAGGAGSGSGSGGGSSGGAARGSGSGSLGGGTISRSGAGGGLPRIRMGAHPRTSGLSGGGTGAHRGRAPDLGGGAGGTGGSWYDAVMRAEGTAGKDPYNVVLGNGRYGLPSKPLTDMTLREAYAFGKTVRARHGSSSAIGAFQIVGNTMKTFMGEAGLGWDDKFSPENQRKLADVIRRRQGFGAWEGLKIHRGELARAQRAVRDGVPYADPAGSGFVDFLKERAKTQALGTPEGETEHVPGRPNAGYLDWSINRHGALSGEGEDRLGRRLMNLDSSGVRANEFRPDRKLTLDEIRAIGQGGSLEGARFDAFRKASRLRQAEEDARKKSIFDGARVPTLLQRGLRGPIGGEHFGPSIPDPPAGGFGGIGGRGDMQGAADRMHAAAERMEKMSVNTHHTFEVTGSGRDSLRAKGMRATSSGPIQADVGISMPHTRPTSYA